MQTSMQKFIEYKELMHKKKIVFGKAKNVMALETQRLTSFEFRSILKF